VNEWLNCFFSDSADITLTLNGRAISRSDCEKIGFGSEKIVYKIKGTNQCFFIPSKCESEKQWNRLIQQEKALLDELGKLGLRTQRFDIASLEVAEAGKPSHAINVLVTRDFASLCEEDGITIYHHKEPLDNKCVYGRHLSFSEDLLKDKTYIQKMFQKIIKEYALAHTFSLPINAVRSCDDSEHYCFESPVAEGEPPVISYMFWDVVSDFSALVIPIVPTMEQLLMTLGLLANPALCAIERIGMRAGWRGFCLDSFREIEGTIILALSDSDLLSIALAHARGKGVKIFEECILPSLDNREELPKGRFIWILKSAISLERLDWVHKILTSKPVTLMDKDIIEIRQFGDRYGTSPIVNYLATHLRLKSEELRPGFFSSMGSGLTSMDKAACGLYSSLSKAM
jgi:hypothetical protein